MGLSHFPLYDNMESFTNTLQTFNQVQKRTLNFFYLNPYFIYITITKWRLYANNKHRCVPKQICAMNYVIQLGK